MTTHELLTERRVTITTRLGILCGADEPTPEQMEIATREADEQEAVLMGLPMPKGKNQ